MRTERFLFAAALHSAEIKGRVDSIIIDGNTIAVLEELIPGSFRVRTDWINVPKKGFMEYNQPHKPLQLQKIPARHPVPHREYARSDKASCQ